MRSTFTRSAKTTALACAALFLVSLALVAQGEKSAQEPITSRAQLDALTPGSANPYVSFLPADVEPDYRYWRAKMRFDAEDRARAQGAQRQGVPNFAESEPNDYITTSDPLTGFSTGGTSTITITGTTDGPVPNTLPNPTTVEPNGTLATATLVPFTVGAGGNQSFLVQSTIGDGAQGSGGAGNGDFDIYRVDMDRGQLLTIDTTSALDSIVAVYNSMGLVLGANDDEPAGVNFNSFLSFTAPRAGTYYVVIGGWRSTPGPLQLKFPSDLTDESSGPGVGAEGAYDVVFSLNDGDLFSVELQAGDVLGVASDITADLSILNDFLAIAEETMGSAFALSGIQPPSSLLPAGISEVSSVAEFTGTHHIRVRNFPSTTAVGTPYTLTASVFRPPSEAETEPQVLFIDFDGASIDAPALFGSGNNPAVLSPLSAFLGGWGLVGQESAVIDAILASIEETLGDLAADNPGFTYELRNSRDHADPFGQPRVSRLIVGGSIAELGIGTIGIAESIDTGNFGFEETAVILLDLLSAPASNPNSLNQFPLDPGATILELVGVGVGNITVHEAGHYLGNWHTDQYNGLAAIQDQGGNLAAFVGLGPDGIFGSGDDEDVDFALDVFNQSEGFTGLESQYTRAGYALSGGAIFSDGFESGDTTSWTSSTP